MPRRLALFLLSALLACGPSAELSDPTTAALVAVRRDRRGDHDRRPLAGQDDPPAPQLRAPPAPARPTPRRGDRRTRRPRRAHRTGDGRPCATYPARGHPMGPTRGALRPVRAESRAFRATFRATAPRRDPSPRSLAAPDDPNLGRRPRRRHRLRRARAPSVGCRRPFARSAPTGNPRRLPEGPEGVAVSYLRKSSSLQPRPRPPWRMASLPIQAVDSELQLWIAAKDPVYLGGSSCCERCRKDLKDVLVSRKKNQTLPGGA